MAGTIRAIYDSAPSTPATNQHPDAVRYFVGPYIVDAVGGQPTQAEIEAVLGLPEKARLDGIRGDAQQQALLAQLKTATAAQIDTYIDNNVTDLASARTMLKRIVKVIAILVR